MTSDTMTTIIGAGEAAGISAVTFWTTSSADGSLNLKNPIFWLGLTIAVLAGVRGYWTNKEATPAPAKPPAPPAA